MIVAFLGAVYGGCCYCPLDAGMPAERIRTILSVMEPAAMIVDSACAGLAESLEVKCPRFLFEELAAGESG